MSSFKYDVGDLVRLDGRDLAVILQRREERAIGGMEFQPSWVNESFNMGFEYRRRYVQERIETAYARGEIGPEIRKKNYYCIYVVAGVFYDYDGVLTRGKKICCERRRYIVFGFFSKGKRGKKMMTKYFIKCSDCKQEKEATNENFSYSNKKKGIFNRRCKECHNKYTKKHYEENAQDYKDNRKENREQIKEMIKESKRGKCCAKCGALVNQEFFFVLLDYHHRDSEEKFCSISESARVLGSWKRVEEEIKKCDLICKNCHAIETYQDAQKKKEEKIYGRNNRYQKT